MEWVLGFAVILAAAVTMAVVGRMRNVSTGKKVRLEIANAGNVQSRYDLRARDPEGALQFEFTLDGDALPVSGLPAAAAGKAERQRRSRVPGRGVIDRARKVFQLSSALEGILTAVAAMLPRSVGGPLRQKASQIRAVQGRTSYAVEAPERLALQASGVKRALTGRSADPPMRPGRRIFPGERERMSAAAATAGPADGLAWAQTPPVQPGGNLVVELRIRAAAPARSQAHTFQVISRAADAGAERQVSTEGSVHIRGGFWARRILPYVLVGAVAVVLIVGLVMLGYWLVAAGVLG